MTSDDLTDNWARLSRDPEVERKDVAGAIFRDEGDDEESRVARSFCELGSICAMCATSSIDCMAPGAVILPRVTPH